MFRGILFFILSVFFCQTVLADDAPTTAKDQLVAPAPKESQADQAGKPTDDEEYNPHEFIRRPIKLIFDESWANNIGPAEFLEIVRAEGLPESLREAYDASTERKRAEDLIFDTWLNALGDIGAERGEQTDGFQIFLRGVDRFTPLIIDIENRQPGGPGTPNKLFIDVSFGFRRNGEDNEAEDAEDKKGKIDRFDHGLRFSGLTKPPGYRFERLTGGNGMRPIEHDLIFNPFKQSIEWGIERRLVQGLNFALEYDYTSYELKAKIRKPIGRGINLSLSVAHNFDNGEPAVFARLERRF